MRAALLPKVTFRPRVPALNLSLAFPGDGRLLPRRGHSPLARPRLHRGGSRRLAAGRYRQPHSGPALLAGPGPHWQAHALGACRRPPLPWMTVVGEIGDIKQTAADAATTGAVLPARRPVHDFVSQICAPGPVECQRSGFHRAAHPLPPNKWRTLCATAVRSIDPQLPLTQVESMEHVVEEGQAPRHFNAMLISSFAGAAVLLALLGIYSVIAFSAALRTQEMAIRLALGSERAGVMRLILAFRRQARPYRLRLWRGGGSLCHSAAALTAVPGRSSRPCGDCAGGALDLPAGACGFGHSCAPRGVRRPCRRCTWNSRSFCV